MRSASCAPYRPPATTPAGPAPGQSRHSPSPRRSMKLRGRVQVRLLLVLPLLLVVDGLGVHGPDVVIGPVHEVVHRTQCRQRGVVAVVVSMQAVAADLDEVVEPVEPGADRR